MVVRLDRAGLVGKGGGEALRGERDLVIGGDLSSVSLVGKAILQALLQLVHMLLHIVDAGSWPLHSPAMLLCKARFAPCQAF